MAVLTVEQLSTPLVGSAQPTGSPASTCVIQMDLRGQKLIRGGLICSTGRGASGLDTLRGQRLLLASGRLTLRRLGAFLGTACLTFRICKEIQPSARLCLLPSPSFMPEALPTKGVTDGLRWHPSLCWSPSL